jgi:hypothetical protein
MIDMWRGILERREQERLIDIDYFAATANFGSGILDVAEFYKDVVEAKKQMFGPSHSEVVNSMLLYSRLLGQAGDRAQAELLAAQAEELRTGVPIESEDAQRGEKA